MKRLISTLLAVVMLVSVIPASLAASDEAMNAAQALNGLGLFRGVDTNEDGTPIYDLDRAPTRQEAITMLVRLLGKEEEAKAGSWVIPFTDVVEWAVPYVGYAYTNGLVAGLSDTVFGSQDSVSAAQYLTFILRALGHSSSTDFQWDAAWELSDKIGLTDGRYNAGTTTFTRGDVVIVSESMLAAKNKGSDTTVLSQLVAAGAVSKETADNYTGNAAPAEESEETAVLTKNDIVVKLVIPHNGTNNWYVSIEVSNYTGYPMIIDDVGIANGYAVYGYTSYELQSMRKVSKSYYRAMPSQQQNRANSKYNDMYLDNNSIGFIYVTWRDVKYRVQFDVNGTVLEISKM